MSTANSSLFCNKCNNMLNKITGPFLFEFICEQCNERRKPNENDFLIYEDGQNINLVASNNILRHATSDLTNEKVHIKGGCARCKHGFARRVRIGADMRLIDTCIKCKHQILYSE